MASRAPRLDEVDWEILKRLASDGRARYNDMAREFGVATSTVLNRVQRLQASGVIERFTMTVDPEKVKRPLTVFLGVRVLPERKAAVIEKLRSMETVLELYEMLEPYDLLAKVRTDSIPTLKESVLRMLSSIEGVLGSTTFLTTRRHKEVACHF